MDYKAGDRVRHPGQPAWGIGQVLEGVSGNRAPVFFISGKKKVISVKHVALELIEGEEAESMLLDNLSVNDKPDFQYITFDEALAKFKARYPQGFDDPTFLTDERQRKVTIHESMVSTLGPEVFGQLIEEEKYQEACELVLKIIKETDLIFPNEKATLRKGLKIEENQEIFTKHLYGLLYGDEDEKLRFDVFAKALGTIKAAKWTIATFFPFITFPDRKMFLKPPVTKPAADHSAFNINYDSALNWKTLEGLERFVEYVKTHLNEAGLEPRDHFDIHSFIASVSV